MTWRADGNSSNFDAHTGGASFDDVRLDQTMNDRADLSSAIWRRDSGCGSGGCCCGCCHGGGRERPLLEDPQVIRAGVNEMTRILQGLGVSIDLPTLWPQLYPDSNNPQDRGSDIPLYPSSNGPIDDTSDRKTITVSNGDHLTLGGMHGFTLTDKDGMPVTTVKTLDSGAMDAPVEHVLSNGAIYRSRGGWNHDESITWPNGDVVRFSDAGKFESYEPHN